MVDILRRRGFDATQSSVSRDLRELGVAKAGDRYIIPVQDHTASGNGFALVAGFVREVLTAGAALTVIKTTAGTASSVALAIDRAAWPEVAGTVAGDDTLFVATANAKAQRKLLGRLGEVFTQLNLK